MTEKYAAAGWLESLKQPDDHAIFLPNVKSHDITSLAEFDSTRV